EGVSGAPASGRKFLLKLKRDTFNGRPLSDRAASDPRILSIEGAAELLDRIVEIDRRRRDLEGEMRRTLRGRQTEERAHLVESLRDPELRRGIALASPVTAENLYRLEGTSPEVWGKRERRLELSGLRFLSRAAVKTSPYSTFTRSAFAVVAGEIEGGPGAAWLGSGMNWRQHSRLRLKRYLPEADLALLLRHDAFVEGLSMALNDTFERLADGVYQFLRPTLYAPAKGELKRHTSILLKVKMSGSVMERLASRDLKLPAPLAQIVAQVCAEAGVEAAEARAFLQRLVDVGILSFIPPWSVTTPQLESEIYRRLSVLEEAGLEPATRLFAELVELAGGFANSTDPAATIRRLDGVVDELYGEVAPRVGIRGVRQKNPAGNYYEDVHLTFQGTAGGLSEVSRPPRPFQPCVEVSAATVRELEATLEPLNAMHHALHRRHGLLITLDAFMREKWPDRVEVPLLEAFAAFRGHWKAFKGWLEERYEDYDYTLVFNPLGLPELDRHRAQRTELIRTMIGGLREGSESWSLDAGAISEALEAMPSAFGVPCGPCAFLQPADPSAKTWVLNKVTEGTGRYGARFAAAMPETVARDWVAFQGRPRRVEVGGQAAAWLDLWTANFDTLNLHEVHTDFVLALPGNHFTAPADKVRRLTDLRLRRGEAGTAPHVVDGDGQLFFPVYLGGTGIDFSPPAIDFLAQFGTGDFSKPPKLPVPEQDCADGRRWPRLVCGPLVLNRRRWWLETAGIQDKIHGLDLIESMVQINRWRCANGVPDRVFLIEPVGDGIYKPQYVDFTSPLFSAVLLQSLKKFSPLAFEEALPDPGDLPLDGQSTPWNFEMQFEFDPADSEAQPEAP
ncbi:MAG: lantibiotic dehydratase, partial [Acidobacteriota bacterium]